MRQTTRRQANHPLHLVLTLVTCGMWAPFWIGAAIIGRRETVTVYQPPPVHYTPPPPPWPPQQLGPYDRSGMPTERWREDRNG
jgi:hypothetical protein